MKKNIIMTACLLCLPFSSRSSITCDADAFERVSNDVMARCVEMKVCQQSESGRLAEFVHSIVKELMFEFKNGELSDYYQEYYLCSYDILCSLLGHQQADSIEAIDKAWIEELDYGYWKSFREESARYPGNPERSLDQLVITSFLFYRAKLRHDPHGIWDDYAMRLRHAYRFLKERQLIDDSMTLENSDDWIHELDDRIS
jgi:hypothetical protein